MLGRRRDLMMREEIRQGNEVVGRTIQIYHAPSKDKKKERERQSPAYTHLSTSDETSGFFFFPKEAMCKF